MKRQSLNAWIICPRKCREKLNSQGLNTGQPDSTFMCFLLFHSNTQETDPRQLRQNESKNKKKKKKKKASEVAPHVFGMVKNGFRDEQYHCILWLTE